MGSEQRRLGRGTALALGAAFLLSIWLPLFDAWLGLAPVLPNFEKREYASRPALLPAWEDAAPPWSERLAATLASLDRFPAGFESWHDDHFGLRSHLIRWHNIWKARWLATPPNDEVVIGRDGWLYFSGQSNIEQYRALTPMPPELVAAWKLYLAIVREWVEDHGAAYLLVIGPSKETVHPEHLPATIRQVGATTRLEQFTDELAREGRQWVLDLTPALLAASAERPTYQKTDTHWNSWGSLVAVRALLDELRASGRFPGLAPLGLADYRAEERLQEGGDIAELMGLTDLYGEVDLVYQPTFPDPLTWTTEGLPPAEFTYHAPYAAETDPASLADPAPRVLVFHDSFGPYLASFLPRFFARTVFYWQYQPSPAALAQEEPALVLQEVGERVLIRDELKGGDVPFPLDERVRTDFERRRAFRASSALLFRREAPPSLDLPAFAPPAAGEVALLRLELDVAAAGTVAVEPCAHDAPEQPRALLAGHNVVYLRLCADGRASRLVVAASGAEPRSLEARAVRPWSPAASGSE